MRFEFTSPLCEWSTAAAPWYFVELPEEVSDDLAEIPRMPRGFGAIKVLARVGGSSWLTSVFPDSRTGGHWLPIKKAVRMAEGLSLDGPVAVQLELVEL